MRGRRKTVRISEAEWAVMQVLWRGCDEKTAYGMTLGEVISAVAEKSKWSNTTIRTLVIRLSEKGVVDIDKSSGVYKYSPRISREECLKEEVALFVKRVFNGSPFELMSVLLGGGGISEDEKKQLATMLAAE